MDMDYLKLLNAVSKSCLKFNNILKCMDPFIDCVLFISILQGINIKHMRSLFFISYYTLKWAR